MSEPVPVPVHILSAEAGLQLGGMPRRPHIVTIYRTIVLTADNPWSELVPQNHQRHSWQFTGGQGSATLAANDVLIGANQGDIMQAAAKAETLNLPGKFVPANTLGYTSPMFYGHNAVWIAVLGASPTYPMYIGVADHVYGEETVE